MILRPIAPSEYRFANCLQIACIFPAILALFLARLQLPWSNDEEINAFFRSDDDLPNRKLTLCILIYRNTKHITDGFKYCRALLELLLDKDYTWSHTFGNTTM